MILFNNFFSLWISKSMNLGDLQAHLWKTKVFQMFAWICVCELYWQNSSANIAFQPVMYRPLVVCRNKLFVHESIIKQNKPTVSRLHSFGFCVFHWKDQEVLYGNFFICMCKVRKICNTMCVSRSLLHCWWYQLCCRYSSWWGKVGHQNNWICRFLVRLFLSLWIRPLIPPPPFFFLNRDLSGK